MLYQNCFMALMMSIWKCNDFCKVYIPTTIITGYPTNPLMSFSNLTGDDEINNNKENSNKRTIKGFIEG